jgi:hypothetical protein
VVVRDVAAVAVLHFHEFATVTTPSNSISAMRKLATDHVPTALTGVPSR